MPKILTTGNDSATAWMHNKARRKADINKFSADAAACSKFARR
ncbi:MAG: hypothetical protein OQK48_03165 [Sulfurimonas sp.]|nr:hypothetical protein [Sulfurimonas sp.]MCW9068375.1 hypothetical protein [Sulfurimonas sp.]